jgi:dihydrofolate synthase/folylpolyglutamate synthase
VLRHAGWDGIVVDARTPSRRLDGLRVGLLGAHQADNAAVALALLEAMDERWGLGLDETLLRTGMEAAEWPGRLELLDGTRIGVGRVLLDGAHNPAGAAALARALKDLGLRRPTIVFGAMRGKKVRDVLRALAPLDPRFVFTRVDDPHAHTPTELARAWRQVGGRGGLAAPTPREALRRAAGDPVVVAGSLYLVGAVRGMIVPDGEED